MVRGTFTCQCEAKGFINRDDPSLRVHSHSNVKQKGFRNRGDLWLGVHSHVSVKRKVSEKGVVLD